MSISEEARNLIKKLRSLATEYGEEKFDEDEANRLYEELEDAEDKLYEYIAKLETK